jgi:large subunit ribosomal protein L13
MSKKEAETLVDASNLILGRMASAIAKRLLNGEAIVVLNAEKALVSGKKHSKIKEIKKFLEVGGVKYGPFHPRRPDRILRRTVRGMLPWDSARGKGAYKRLKVYIGVPGQYKDKPVGTLQEATARLRGGYTTLGELASEIGWKPVGES